MYKRMMMVLLLAAVICFPLIAFAQDKQYSQKDGLFSVNVPEGWQWSESIPEYVYIIPPDGVGGIMIYSKKDTKTETPEEIKSKLRSINETIIETKLKPEGGTIIEDKETTIDNVYARRLSYTIPLKEQLFYFVRITFVYKDYVYAVHFGNPKQEELAKMESIVNTLKLK